MNSSPIGILFDRSTMKCTICGAPSGTCDCWERCHCGFSFPKGEECKNPLHAAEAIAAFVRDAVMADLADTRMSAVARSRVENRVYKHVLDMELEIQKNAPKPRMERRKG